MNYFEDHIGDYAAATAHLSWDEDMAYSRLIRAYYHHEKPIPADISVACRIARATTPNQKKAIKTVLEEFFVLEVDGWHQKRCDSEIARFRDKQAKAKRSAETRWNANKTHTEGNANASPDAMRTHTEGNAPIPTHHTQAPDPIKTSVVIPTQDNSESAIACVDFPAGLAGSVCKALMADGIHGCNPHNPTLLALLEAGATLDEFRHAAPAAIGKSKPFNYLVSTVQRMREEAAKLVLHKGVMPASKPDRFNPVADIHKRMEDAQHGRIIDVN